MANPKLVIDVSVRAIKAYSALKKVEKKASDSSTKVKTKFTNAFKTIDAKTKGMASKVIKSFGKITLAAAAAAATIATVIAAKTWIGFKKLVSGLASLTAKAGKALAKGLGVALAAATAGTIALLKNTVQLGDEIDKNSQKMGISAEGYQKWSYILDRCGASMESMKPAMKKLAVAAQTGNSAFAQLGISQQELATLSQEELFGRTVQALQNMESSSQRTYLASQLLGRGATELGAVFNMTGAETNELVERLNYLGGTMSDSAVKNCAALMDAWTDLKMAFRGVGNILAEYVVPIITSAVNNVIIPAVVRIRQALEALFGKIPLFKRIKEAFNKKTTKDINSTAGAVSNVGSGLGKAGKAAKKTKKEVQALKRELMGFDQITKLSGENGTNNDSGTTPANTGGSGDTGGIGDLEDVDPGVTPSQAVANWWNEFKKSWNAIDWSQIGTSLASKLNNAIAKIDGVALGRKLAGAINDAFDFLYSFITTFNWGQLGTKIADFVNSSFENINWSKIGKTLGEGVNGAIDFLFTTITKIKWGDIGKDIGKFVNNSIDTIDFKKMGRTLSEGIHGAFSLAINTIETINWGEIAKSITDFFKGIDFKQFGKDLSTLVADIIDALAKLFRNLDPSVIFEAVLDFLMGVDWGAVILALLKLLGSLLLFNIELILAPWKALFNVLTDHMDSVKEKIGEKVSGFKDKIVNGFNAAKEKAAEKIDDIKKKWDQSEFKQKIADVKAQIATKAAELKEKWNNLTKNVKDYTAHVKAEVATRWANLKDKWNNLVGHVKDKTADIKAKVKSKWSDLRSKWETLMGHFKDKTTNIKLKFAAAASEIKGWINRNVIDRINNKMRNIPILKNHLIPRLAEGGYIKANTPQLAMIGDNRREGEIVAPESKLAAMAQMAAAGTENNETNMLLRQLIALVSNMNLNVELDGEKIKNNTVRRINNHTRATGQLEILI